MNEFQKVAFNQELSLMEFFSDTEYVAKLVGYCKEPACLIMKYYSAGSLNAWVSNGKAKMKKVKMSIVNDIAKGISVLHYRQVAHSDLKPQNVLVDYRKGRECFVLTDFGISKILTTEYLASKAFQISNVRGLTKAYAAPEVIKRYRRKDLSTNAELEKMADIYSFGVVIFYVLHLKKPWGSRNSRNQPISI
jgi:serine/threonine protein kinase